MCVFYNPINKQLSTGEFQFLCNQNKKSLVSHYAEAHQKSTTNKLRRHGKSFILNPKYAGQITTENSFTSLRNQDYQKPGIPVVIQYKMPGHGHGS